MEVMFLMLVFLAFLSLVECAFMSNKDGEKRYVKPPDMIKIIVNPFSRENDVKLVRHDTKKNFLVRLGHNKFEGEAQGCI